MTGLNDDAQGEARYQALSRLPPVPDSIPRLVAALYDESWRVRKLASELLSRAEATPPLLTALLGVLADRGQTGARNAAASALALLGAEAVGPLVTLLGHADADQRKLAADVLGEVRRPEAVPALLNALQDADLNVQAAAAEALGRIGGHEACRALERLLRASEPLLQVAALEGLAQQAHAPPLPLVVPLLAPAATRRSAYRVLGRVSHPAAFTLLLQGLGTAARDAALAGLGAREVPPGADGDAAIGAVARRIDDAQARLAQALRGDDLAARRGALWVASAWNRASLAPAVA
ncbi:MAG: HEAT repeat domain-containing protein, partial [Myxococcaceae bacterium]|nr:HEAT repeat domain-containing protein [Myxococcaceae bacterium]